MVLVLAHRGASRVAPENTVEAFAAARRLGADGVELDVRRSADGALVVHHDPSLPGVGPIAGQPASGLPRHVPLLAAAIEACGPALVVNIELKDLPGEPGYDASYPLSSEVARFAVAHGLAGRVVISSFDLSALDAVRAAEPSLATGWLIPGAFDPHAALGRVAAHGHRALHPHHAGVTAELVAAAHAGGIAVTAWTADEPDDILRLAAAGVDGIITNAPDVARRVLSGGDQPAGTTSRSTAGS